MVIVVPKAWRPVRPGVVVRWPEGEAVCTVLLAEGERCLVYGDEGALAAVRGALMAAFAEQRRTATAAPVLAPLARASLGRPDDAPVSARSTQADMLALLRLLLLTDRTALAVDDVGMGAFLCDLPEFRLLLHARFVEALGLRLPFLRRGYTPVVEEGLVLRGRLVAESVMAALVRGRSRLAFAYDDFTRVSPLAVVLASALAECMRGPRCSGLAALGRETRRRSSRLSRHLDGISPLPPSQALRLAESIVLDRHDRGFARPLALAKLVLNRRAALPAGGPHSVHGLVLRVPTARVWERVVREAVHRTAPSGARVREGILEAPWAGLSDRPSNPDVMIELHSGEVALVDAKYKLLDGATAPDRSDLYQLYAYSHLVARHAPVVGCALVYPGPVAHRGPFARVPVGEDAVSLTLCWAPFPSPEAVESARSWDESLRGVGTALWERLGFEDIPPAGGALP